MKKILQLGFAALFLTTASNAQTTIAAARGASTSITASSAPTVSTKGIVLNGSELGSIRYIQDATGGLAVFNASATANINRGDSITVTGPLVGRYGVLQIAFNSSLSASPVTVVKTSSNNTLPAPFVITNTQFFQTATAEPTESELIRINGGTFAASGTFTCANAGSSYTVNYPSGNFVIARLTQTNNPIVGTAIPTGPVDIIGITSQFCGAPSDFSCTTGYQIVPRDLNDIIVSTVGLKDESAILSTISIYPNPTSGVIKFNSPKNEIVKSIMVTDISGRIVYQENANLNSVDLNSLPNGVYNLTVSTSSKNYRAKVNVIK